MTPTTIEHDAVKEYKEAVSKFNAYKKVTNTDLLNELLDEYWTVIVGNKLQDEYFRVTIPFDYFSEYTQEKLQTIVDKYKLYSKDCYYTISTDSKYKTDTVVEVIIITLVHI
jgi:hypothetical protein